MTETSKVKKNEIWLILLYHIFIQFTADTARKSKPVQICNDAFYVKNISFKNLNSPSLKAEQVIPQWLSLTFADS
uniref:Uncharacterized protein n=1 Tax=Octopus bimaculoides TaxID=37653 RepID=A0A0L8GY70_OCTBM